LRTSSRARTTSSHDDKIEGGEKEEEIRRKRAQREREEMTGEEKSGEQAG
jgi:hypothetical protein